MNKIKVLQIIGNACRGGVETYILNYYNLMNKEFEFTFVCYGDSPYIYCDEISKLGGKIKLISNIKHLCKFKKDLKKILTEEKYDIVHSHLNALSVFPLGVAKKCGYKIRVASSHTCTNRKDGLKHFVKVFLAKFSTKNANKYQAISYDAGKYLFGAKNLPEVKIINAQVDLERFKYDSKKRNVLRKELGLQDSYVVGNVGRLCSAKNQEFILEIARKMQENKEFKFIIIGDGKKEKMLKKLNEKYELENVMFISNKQNIFDYYNIFDLFILPSIYEGFGLVNLEAQANGLYCLQSNCFTDEAIVDGYGKSLSLNVKEWAEEISKKPSRRENVQKVLDSKFTNKTINILADSYEEYLK